MNTMNCLSSFSREHIALLVIVLFVMLFHLLLTGCSICRYYVDEQGVVSVAGEERRVLVQAVHEVFQQMPTTKWSEAEDRLNTLVFIGMNLNAVKLCFWI